MENVENLEMRKIILMNEYKHRIDGLREQFSQEEIEAANSGAVNAYSEACAAQLSARDQAIAALTQTPVGS